MNTIKELIVAYKLFDRAITYQDLLAVEFNDIYILTRYQLPSVEHIPIQLDSTTICFLRAFNSNTQALKLIKPNLYASIFTITFLEDVFFKEYTYDNSSNNSTSFRMYYNRTKDYYTNS